LLSAYRDLVSLPDVLASTMIPTPAECASFGSAYLSVLPVRAGDGRIGQISRLPAYAEDIEEALLRQTRQKTRNLIRKSLKQGFCEIASDEEWAWRFLYKTHSGNMAAIGGKAKPWSHFLAIRRSFPAAWRRLTVAMLSGVPVAALLLLAYKDSVEYMTPTVMQEYRARQPLSFLIWHAMLHASRKGMTTWNWGGTWIDQTTLHHFKAGWGAEDHPYTYFVCASNDGLARLRKNKTELSMRFPYWYVYPYSELS
jgi:hypothetical protein